MPYFQSNTGKYLLEFLIDASKSSINIGIFTVHTVYEYEYAHGYERMDKWKHKETSIQKNFLKDNLFQQIIIVKVDNY